ncbi:Ser/Thr phosphatase family protein [Dictyocaulus viviparus]|uniref:Tartrate-resistant acid phosphatase type 5 n=1 Tax=Dictyocaulus viviparus TaxID=29172 RepID=A0A0D8XQ42_DICVI|nr:Ser/Thr phosphatase family protein [Dictyocaulus viviparus]
MDAIYTNLYGFDNVLSRGNLIDNLSTNTSLRVILLGDIGGLPVYPYYTYAQTKVANAITDIAIQKKPHFVLNLGDNFYFTGVSNEYDKRFESSFENIYDTDALQVPWYTVAGNHDHFGNVSAQVAYTKYSKKWNFPSVYYNLSFHINQTTVDILMIDTVILCGNTADVENGDLFDLLWNKSHDPEGPDDIEQAEKQWKWIEYHLNASSADYLFVAGHYPIHSISSHGPTKCLIERLDPLLKQYSVSAYFAGHDHTLQHIIYPGEGMHLIHYVVSGVASRSDRSKKHLNTVAVENLKFHYPSSWNPFSQLGFSNGGFVYMDINKQRAELFFLNGKGAEKYRTSIVPRSIDSPHFIAF